MTAPVQPLEQARSLGRVYRPDPRDRRFALTPKLMGTIIRAENLSTRKLPWHLSKPLDQGETSECVIHCYMHHKQGAPWVYTLPWKRSERTKRYDLARARDGFPMPHDGTTARAALDIAREQGEIAEYLWVYDEDTAREYIKTRGTLMFGSDWFDGMFTPSKKGAYVEPTGYWAGGHEYLLRWYHGPTHRLYPDTYEFQNSWSASWGDGGLFRMKADAFRYLFLGLNGDLASPMETAYVRPKVAA